MKRFVSKIKHAPKRVAFLVALFTAMIAIPLHSIAAADVLLEGSIGVANQTTGETTYQESTNAKYDEVVKFQVFYHNRELPDSGRVAKNFKVKVDMPSQAGTNQVVKVTMGGDNTNTITDTAIVNLDRPDAHLEFIPGSVYWSHNIGTRTNVNDVTQNIPDSTILDGSVLEAELQPCHEFEATVTFMARVKIPSIGITKKVRKAGTNDATTTDLAVAPGTRLEYGITAKNLSNETLTNVYLRDPLPKGLTFVPGTAKKYYGTYDGTVMTADEANAFFNGRKNIGSLDPGAQAFITFEATVGSAEQLACGVNIMKNIAVVDTDQTGEYNNFATVTSERTTNCNPNTPVYSCDLLKVESLADRKVRVAVDYTAKNGATFSNVTYNFGDGSANMLTDKQNVEHQYAKDGTYTIAATVRFKVDNQDKTATSEQCSKQVTFTSGKPVTPGQLPNTGPADMAGIFAAVSIAGALAHRLFWARRKLMQ